jgi:hypothetical protein
MVAQPKLIFPLSEPIKRKFIAIRTVNAATFKRYIDIYFFH